MSSSKKNVSTFQIIYESLRKKIFFGEYQPGSLLPSENALCTEFQASRETVRKGLKLLLAENLVYSKPKVGYFVSMPNHTDLNLEFMHGEENTSYHYKDVRGMLPDEHLQNMLKIPGSQKVIKVSQTIENEKGEVLALENNYIPYVRSYPSVEGAIRYAVLPDPTFEKMTSYEYYSEVSVRAILVRKEIAEILQCEEGVPVLLTERKIISQDGTRLGYFTHYGHPEREQLSGLSGKKL